MWCFDVEYIYGFVRWGVCMQSRWRHSVTVPHTRWRICVTIATLWQQQNGGYKMPAICYYGNVMATTIWRLRVAIETLSQHFLHLQEYSRRLNFFHIRLNIFFYISCVVRLPFSTLPYSYTHNGDGSPKSYTTQVPNGGRTLLEG